PMYATNTPTDPGGGTSVEPPTQTPPCTEKQPSWLPMTTLYDLPLAADPKFNELMCKSKNGIFGGSGGDSISSSDVAYPGMPVTPGPGPDGKYPAKNDPH